MHFISPLGIRGRLVAGFTAVCGIIAAAVGYTVFAVDGISTTVDRMVNLRTPGLEVKLGGALNVKTYTSEYARLNDCGIAINGEAGVSPAPRSGLGEWRGNMIKDGKLVLQEDPKLPRPFLSFDRNNHAIFTPSSAPNRTLGQDAYNVIWGRDDAIVNGVVPSADDSNRQPRTAMAINRDGTHLYLLVVDGRQPNYSMGCTLGEVAQLLKDFGAYNGMLCDEGGSTCIY